MRSEYMTFEWHVEREKRKAYTAGREEGREEGTAWRLSTGAFLLNVQI